VLKCPDDWKNRVVNTQATYPCGSSAVGDRLCEQRYARRSEFCQRRGLSFGALDRHLKKLRWKRKHKPISSASRLVPVKSKLQYAELRIRVLEERLRLMRIEKYGAGGEKLSQAQMQLFKLKPVVSEMIEQTVSEAAPNAWRIS
jgi:hypothetical protein